MKDEKENGTSDGSKKKQTHTRTTLWIRNDDQEERGRRRIKKNDECRTRMMKNDKEKTNTDVYQQCYQQLSEQL